MQTRNTPRARRAMNLGEGTVQVPEGELMLPPELATVQNAFNAQIEATNGSNSNAAASALAAQANEQLIAQQNAQNAALAAAAAAQAQANAQAAQTAASAQAAAQAQAALKAAQDAASTAQQQQASSAAQDAANQAAIAAANAAILQANQQRQAATTAAQVAAANAAQLAAAQHAATVSAQTGLPTYTDSTLDLSTGGDFIGSGSDGSTTGIQIGGYTVSPIMLALGAVALVMLTQQKK